MGKGEQVSHHLKERLSASAKESLSQQQGFHQLRELMSNLGWGQEGLNQRLDEIRNQAPQIGSTPKPVAQASLGEFLGRFAGGGDNYEQLTAGLDENDLTGRLARVLVAGSGVATNERDFLHQAFSLASIITFALEQVEVKAKGEAPCLVQDQDGRYGSEETVVGLVLNAFQKPKELTAEPVSEEKLLAVRVAERLLEEAGLETTPEELGQIILDGLASRAEAPLTVEEGQVRKAVIEAFLKDLTGKMAKGKGFRAALSEATGDMPEGVKYAVGEFLVEYDRAEAGKQLEKPRGEEVAGDKKAGESLEELEEERSLSQEEIAEIRAGEKLEPIKLKLEKGEISQASFSDKLPDADEAIIEGRLRFEIKFYSRNTADVKVGRGKLSVIDLKRGISHRMDAGRYYTLVAEGEMFLQINGLPLLRFDGVEGDEVIFTPIKTKK